MRSGTGSGGGGGSNKTAVGGHRLVKTRKRDANGPAKKNANLHTTDVSIWGPSATCVPAAKKKEVQ